MTLLSGFWWLLAALLREHSTAGTFEFYQYILYITVTFAMV